MSGHTQTGYLKINLDVSVLGPMQKNQAQKIESDLLDFFRDRGVNIDGKISFVSIDTFDIKKAYSNLDTSTI